MSNNVAPESPRPTALEIASAVRGGRRRAVDVVDEALARISAQDPALNAFLRVDAAGARAAAEAVDRAVVAGEDPGPLAGVPLAVKDQIITRGLESTAASRILDGFVPPYDSTAVARLRAAGAVVVGKTNQDEFGMGSSNEHSPAGPCNNPWAIGRVPGGSSGGSAAAVAAGMVPLALGTDTGGSIRQPASFCGVVGIKPTYGRVSRYGAIAYASSLDQIGPMAQNTADSAVALRIMAGHDPRDATSSDCPVDDYLAACSSDAMNGLRVGVPAEYFGEGMDAGVREAVQGALNRLEGQGATVVPISLPHTQYAVATYYVIATAEASSNLSRYDGVRYGRRAEASELTEMYEASRAEGFGSEVRRRILLGTFVLSSGYYDEYYEKAQRVRTLVGRDFVRVFEGVDVVAAPVAPTVAFAHGHAASDPLQMYLMDIYTIGASLAGLPALSVPCGFADELPVGLQLIGPAFSEARLMGVAAAHERAWDGADQRPTGSPS